MDRLIEEFKDYLHTKKVAVTTQRQYPEYVEKFSEFVKGDLINVNKKDLISYVSYLQKRNIKPTTVGRYITTLNTFYAYLVFTDQISINPVTGVKKFCLEQYKNHPSERQCPTIDEIKLLLNNIVNPLDLAVVVLLLKTGVRRHELSDLDLKDVDLKNMSILLKETNKRSNRKVFHDEEGAYALDRWIKRREKENIIPIDALFINRSGKRLSAATINRIVKKYATVAGLHHPESKDLGKRLTAHSMRHFFTTSLLQQAKMRREYVQWLRSDSISSAIDQYFHIDADDVQKVYLSIVPKFGLL